MIAEKRCRHCNLTKAAGFFPKNARISDGLNSWCRACMSAAARMSMAKKPDYYRVRDQQRDAAKRDVRRSALIGASCVVPWASCLRCGDRFVVTKHRDSGYCTRRCAITALWAAGYKARSTGPHRQPQFSKTCAFCGQSFIGTARRRFCTPICGTKWHRDIHRHAKRLMGSGPRVDPVLRQEIAERDGWVCALCASPVDPALHGTNAIAPSLDHIVPISLGGTHTRDNLQLAHFGCNSRKGNRVTVAA